MTRRVGYGVGEVRTVSRPERGGRTHLISGYRTCALQRRSEAGLTKWGG